MLYGADRLKISQSDTNRVKNNQDFHLELLRLRQNWRLKKVGNTILGDLSYKSAGSRFNHSGIFEVSKAEEPSGSSDSSEGQTKPSMIKVTIPAELEGTAYIQVTIQKGIQIAVLCCCFLNAFLTRSSIVSDQDILCSTSTSLLHSSLTPSNQSRDAPWTRKLEAAQNVLFCKELFSHLAREAVQLPAPIPHMVVGNQITASVSLIFLVIQ